MGAVIASLIFKKWLTSERQNNEQLNSQNVERENQIDQLQIQLQEELQKTARYETQLIRLGEIEQSLKQAHSDLNDQKALVADLRQEKGAAISTIAARDAEIQRTRESVKKLQEEMVAYAQESKELKAKLATATTELEGERKQSKEKLALLDEAKEQLALRFKNLASEIFDEKAKRFTTKNQESIDQLLTPFKTKIVDFQKLITDFYHREGEGRTKLEAQVEQLMSFNKRLSDEANNLTNALKGQSKTRGDWGEFLLERVLEVSGLRKDQEYTVQESHTREDGSRVQPDVVIHLPGDKHLVIDSKVSLNAYLEFTESKDEDQRIRATKSHLQSIKTHIKGLSAKNYQDLYGIKSPDFVIMFVPIEPAFALAISSDVALWQEAWNKNVLIVSPSTLLFVIRTVAHIWHQERQSQNAQEIADRGGLLYDKFKSFIEDVEKIGERIRQTNDCYEKARGKLYKGRGSLVRQAEMLKELGVKPKQSIKKELIEEAMENSGSLMIENLSDETEEPELAN